MVDSTPGFGKRQYWEDRYTKNPKSYDWLNEPDILDKYLDIALARPTRNVPRILHIGCGNSELSFNLRIKVRDPSQIHNVDYSSVVIDWGRHKEKDMFDSRWEDDTGGSSSATAASEPVMPMMKWDEVDLLSLQSVISSCSLGGYSVILDKSTCDSLACTSSTEVSIPYFLYTDKDDTTSFLDIDTSYVGTANAVQLLAVHLALVSAPKAQWIAYSYSDTRFWFLDSSFDVDSDDHQNYMQLHEGLPHPRDLWTLVERREIIKPYRNHVVLTAAGAADTHYVYVMERTDVALKVRSMDRADAEQNE